MTSNPTSTPNRATKHYSEGISSDGSVILCDGVMMTVPEIVEALNNYETQRISAANQINIVIRAALTASWRLKDERDVADVFKHSNAESIETVANNLLKNPNDVDKQNIAESLFRNLEDLIK